MEKANIAQRIQSIDVLRGIVMVIMALDHVRDYFYKVPIDHAGAVATEPTNLATTYPLLFFTRWITHFCAPVFVFLAGTSVYLLCSKKNKREVSTFLMKRGIWLIAAECILITLAWTFNPFYNLIILQVIWAIGISMLLLGLLIYLPFPVIFGIGAAIVFGHNLLTLPDVKASLTGSFFANLIYYSDFSVYQYSEGHYLLIVYAFLPWTGLMLLGFCFGKLYSQHFDPVTRRKWLLRMGCSLLTLFVVLRFTNSYGDPVPWSQQPRGDIYSFLSFLNVNKYPPSLLFICMTIGAAMIFLALIEKIKNRLTGFFNCFGRVPMFYYILHLYLIHALVVLVFYVQGFTSEEIVTPNAPFLFRPPAFGFSIWGMYGMWLLLILILYPLCRKYERYKRTHTHWWLSYL